MTPEERDNAIQAILRHSVKQSQRIGELHRYVVGTPETPGLAQKHAVLEERVDGLERGQKRSLWAAVIAALVGGSSHLPKM